MKFYCGLFLFATVATSLGNVLPGDRITQGLPFWTAREKQQVLNIASEYCKNVSGLEDGATKIFNGAEKFVDCVVKTFDPNDLQEKFERLKQEISPDNAVAPIFRAVCPKVNEFFDCLDDFIGLFPYCLDNESMDTINLIVGVVKRAINFICHNNGEHVVKWFVDGGVECIMEHHEEFGICYENAKRIYTNNNQHEFGNEAKNLKFFKITKNDCNEYDHQYNCLVDKMKTKCPKKTISEIVHDFFVEIKDESPCDALQNVV